MRRLKEWWWALVASLIVNGYLPTHFTWAETGCFLVILWITILFGIYWVEERMEKHGREI